MKNNASLVYNFCLLVGDALAIVMAFTIAYILRVSLSHVALSAPVKASDYILALISLIPFWLLLFGLLGLYNSRIYERRFNEFGRLLIGSFIGILFVISYSYIADVTIFPARLVTVYSFGLAFFFALLFRTTARGFRRELFSFGIGINNVLLIGDNNTTATLVKALSDTRVTGYKILGVVAARASKSYDGLKQYKTFNEAIGRQFDDPLHTIIQTELYTDPSKNNDILSFAQKHHVAYRFVPGNSELLVGKIEVDLFQSIPVIAVHQTALIGWGRVVKRLTDIILGTIALVIASPFMLLIALAIKLSDNGPVFFRQERLSRFDSRVNIFKFRSNKMAYNGLDPEEAFAKMGKPELIKQYRDNGDFLANDPRITPLGRWLRKTSLDELPQLLNVVRGDISLVGPRALIAAELDQFAQKSLILSVKSGLTGLAQISGRRDISFDERRKLDLYYVQNWSFWGDIVILVKTVSIVFFHRGAI
ncbi:MAG: Undecaprenyl-phosphate galactose phosphotransferase [Candidatus Saccharibacteria bacterium]|nr:Undecaprenyl-phosphate galactose phosphotransferase [Candidatus Saccharibacteria bacterium]